MEFAVFRTVQPVTILVLETLLVQRRLREAGQGVVSHSPSAIGVILVLSTAEEGVNT
jgi:hypothetical protein